MSKKKVISEIKKILNEDVEKHLYRNLGTIADRIGVDKTNILRAATTCDDISIVFNEENYNPNSGPLLALKENIKSKAKKTRILIEKEKQKEKEKSPAYNQPKRPSKYTNRARVNNFTKKLIKIHEELDSLIKKYSISLSKNDPKLMKKTVDVMIDFTSLINDIIEKNDYTKYELEDKK